MSNATITVRIFPDGTIRSEVKGISGPACADYIPILEKLLQAEAVDSEPTSEYHLVSNQEDLQQVQRSAMRSLEAK